ncbi:MAG: sialate O-acetylesterase [Pseudomonadota bacterium]
MRLVLHLLGVLTTIAWPSMAVASDDPTIYHVYFLGGQSNMDGYGFNADLPKSLKKPQENVLIFHGKTVEDGTDHGGIGKWVKLSPGHGTGFDTDADNLMLTERFGPELSFGHAVSKAQNGKNVAIIKYSRGGTGLIDGVSGYGSWDPDYAKKNRRNQYDNALTAIDQAMGGSDIDGDGKADVLVPAAIIWMQGEADAYDNEAAATNYDRNLKRLMDLFRAAFRSDDLPVVIGQIQDSGSTPETRVMTFAREVQTAQHDFIKNDPCAAIVTATEDFTFLPDRWHYQSDDYVTLGKAFAEKAIELQANCGGADRP